MQAAMDTMAKLDLRVWVRWPGEYGAGDLP
jgi:hypothetical protein